MANWIEAKRHELTFSSMLDGFPVVTSVSFVASFAQVAANNFTMKVRIEVFALLAQKFDFISILVFDTFCGNFGTC